VPLVAWVLTALWCSLLLGASVVWPPAYGLDEPAHIDMAYQYSAHPFTFYGPGQLTFTRGVLGALASLPGIPPQTRFAVAPIPPRGQRPSLAQLGGTARQPNGGPNQMVEHPPLFYWADAVVLRLPGVSSLAWDLQVWLMRLVSVLWMAPVPLICWAACRRVLTVSIVRGTAEAASRLSVLAMVIPMTVPNLIRDGSAVDNDSLLVLTTTLVLYGVARVMTGDLGLRTAALIGVAMAAALWTKGFALALPLVVLLGYLVGARREATLLTRSAAYGETGPETATEPPASTDPTTDRPAATVPTATDRPAATDPTATDDPTTQLPTTEQPTTQLPTTEQPPPAGLRPYLMRLWKPLAVAALGALVGAIWWIRNLVDYGTVQINGYGPTYTRQHIFGAPDNKGTISHFIPTFLDFFTSRIWAEIGIPDPPSPGPLVIYGWFFLVLFGVVAALAVRGRPGLRRSMAVLILAPAAYTGIAAVGSWGDYRHWSKTVPASQGRYLFGGILAVAVLAAVGLYHLVRPRFHDRLVPLVVVPMLLTNAAVWLLILRSWYQPATDKGYLSGTGKALSALYRWSPLPEPLTVLFVIVLPLVTGLAAMGTVGHAYWRRPSLNSAIHALDADGA
jgi:small subunit ribosomal protein S36